MRFTFRLVHTIWFALLLINSSSVLSQGAQIQGPRDSAGVYSGVVYGPIDPSDTLWGIASRYKQGQQFTVYQTMMAIYELNRNAFENGNFNTMVNGSMLQLPSDRYIARIDPQRAKAKAERDDRAFGRNPTSSNAQTQAAMPPVANLKPEIPLVNKEDLSATEQQLQRQLNGLRSQQNRLFDEIKNQMDTSISNTQAIVDNNKKLLERLDQNEQEFLQFRSTLESDFQSRLDTQSEQIQALTDLVKDAQARELEKEANSLMNTLAQPAVLIGGTAFLSLLLLGGVAVWLFKKPKSVSEATAPSTVKKASTEDIIDDELIIGEADDLQDDDTDELLAALESDVDDQSLLDDILSEELEDSIDEVPIEGDDFSEIGDEMLVPDQAPSNDLSESIDLDADDETDEIDLSDDDLNDAIGDTSEDIDNEVGLSKDVVENLLDEEDEESAKSIQDEVIASIDNELPEGIALDEDGQIDEDTLNQIEASIVEKDEELNELTDELTDGLEAGEEQGLSQDDLDDLFDQNSEDADSGEAAADDVSSVVNEDINDDENVDSNDEALIDQESEDDATDLSREEDSIDLSSEDDSIDLSGEDDSIDLSSEDDSIDLSGEDDSIDLTNEDDSIDLTDLSEDSSELSTTEFQESLDNTTSAPTDESEAVNESSTEVNSDEKPSEDIEISEEVISIETDDEAEVDDTDSIAEELLAELESSIEESNGGNQEDEDELDALLDDLGVDEELVVDEMMAEIPSLAEEMSSMNTEQSTSQDKLEDNLGTDSQDLDLSLPTEQDEKVSDVSDSQSNSDPFEALAKDEFESDEDVLSELPDLDGWLDEDEQSPVDDELKTDSGELSSEIEESISAEDIDDDLLKEIEDADFDSLLEEVESISDEDSETLDNPDLDLSALLEESVEEIGVEEDFVDVDDLLAQSESAPELSDDDLALKLNMDIPSMGSASDSNEGDVNDVIDEDSDQASNLDLAQVYIDMGDHEAATEMLQEVLEKGDATQRVEAKSLLEQID